MRSNCTRASSYQKSCSNATPRSKGFCTLAAHETGKSTVPSRSPAGASIDFAVPAPIGMGDIWA
jgi:hypothetical protein